MKKLLFVIVMLIVAGGAFYGGMKYDQSSSSASGLQRFANGDSQNFQDFRNLSPEERQQRFQEMGGANMMRSGRSGSEDGSSFAAGKIISKDSQSITIELREGGSKIIFYSESAEIGKFTSGTSDDLEVGKSATINGKANEDGSITAQSIQIRPAE